MDNTVRSRWISGTNAQSTYTEDESAWLKAILQWRQQTGRLMPDAAELIKLLEGLGYVRAKGALPPAELDRGLALYRKQTGRRFPTFTDTLTLMQSAGYRHRE